MGTRKCDSGWTEALTSQGVCQILNVTNNQAERNLNINLLFASVQPTLNRIKKTISDQA